MVESHELLAHGVRGSVHGQRRLEAILGVVCVDHTERFPAIYWVQPAASIVINPQE